MWCCPVTGPSRRAVPVRWPGQHEERKAHECDALRAPNTRGECIGMCPRTEARCLRDIERHSAADQSYLEDGVRLLELAKDARRLFDRQDAREKRRLLQFVGAARSAHPVTRRFDAACR